MLSNISATLQRFVTRIEREDGQALAEYGLILALVAVACIAALGLLAAGIIGVFGDITAAFP